uniref:Progonadoliberin n=1 Tax=Rhinogobius flumineus TaxID=293145 RepID=A0A387IZR2_9GOBI|nr:gonadotropin-releasing hormone 3 prepropeptide [Rhinogobius flumineus]
MEASNNSKVMVQVFVLALVLQVTLSQHWSYGWLPGGKRSVGELEATIRMMGTGGVVSLPDETSAQTQERLRPYNVINEDSSHFYRKKKFSSE